METNERKCSRCKVIKPIEQFPEYPDYREGRQKSCKKCADGARIRQALWKLKNPEKAKAQNIIARAKVNSDPIRRAQYLQRMAEANRESSKKYRLQAINHYSQGRNNCACCGESHVEFLAIDHINGGGGKHRKQINQPFFRWLNKSNYPEGFRVLCHNCNMALGLYGKCPHKLSV